MNTNSSPPGARARVQRPERSQMQWRPFALDQLLPADHRARVIWRYVDSLNLEPLYAQIQAVEGRAGRDAVDPKILMALWMLATIEAVSSARQLARLCERDLAYLWICGEVGVNYHLLSDFRTGHGDFLDKLLTDMVATLLHQGLVTLEVVAQDGMRVRASAGSSSFRRQQSLEDCRLKAAQQVRRLREESENDEDQNGSNARRAAARQRVAREYEERVEQALKELGELREQKEERKKNSGETARCSTTDPEARIMKMGHGGFQPAYNVQFATAGTSRVIVSVDVINSGSDRGQMEPMQVNLKRRYGQVPKNYLVDGGFATKDEITVVSRQGSDVYAPVHGAAAMQKRGQDPFTKQRGDTAEMEAFRQRMSKDDAKELFRQRSSIAEFPNAVCRNHGLSQFRVRGLIKVKAVALWQALVFNFQRLLHLECSTNVSPRQLGGLAQS